MIARTLLAAIVLFCSAPAGAATLGLLPCTPFGTRIELERPKGPARLVVARTMADWRTQWADAGGTGPAAPVDFDRDIVVGIVTGESHDRIIYRIQLDHADAPTALEVHATDAMPSCGSPATRAGAEFVVTPRSALPVHFVVDSMVDGRLLVSDPAHEGIRSTDLGTVAGAASSSRDKAANREDAEHAVYLALTAAQKAMLAKGPLGRPMLRFPHAWTQLDATRTRDHWVITYGGLVFEVDVATGNVTT